MRLLCNHSLALLPGACNFPTAPLLPLSSPSWFSPATSSLPFLFPMCFWSSFVCRLQVWVFWALESNIFDSLCPWCLRLFLTIPETQKYTHLIKIGYLSLGWCLRLRYCRRHFPSRDFKSPNPVLYSRRRLPPANPFLISAGGLPNPPGLCIGD